MKIVMFTNTFIPHVGGVARSVDRTAAWLRARGHPVLVAAPTFEGAEGREPDVVRIRAIQSFNGSDFSIPLPLTAPLHRAVDRFQPQIVHAHHPFLLGDTALRVAAEFDLPIVFTHHTLWEHYTRYAPLDSPRMKRFAIELATGYADLCDAVFTPSQAIARLLRERDVRTRIEVVPTGVDVAHFASGDGSAFRDRQGIPDDAIVVGHVGRLAEEKNLRFLARAVSAFLASEPRAYAVIVGDGPERSRIRAHFTERKVVDRLRLTGTLEGIALADAYRSMDVFAFASTTETQGLVLTEAMAAGVPVVAIAADVVREVVRDHENGRVLPGAEIADFEAALAWTTRSDNALALERGAAATAHAYSMDRTGEKTLSIYEELHRCKRASRDPSRWATARRRLHEEWILLSHRAETLKQAWPSPKASA